MTWPTIRPAPPPQIRVGDRVRPIRFDPDVDPTGTVIGFHDERVVVRWDDGPTSEPYRSNLEIVE